MGRPGPTLTERVEALEARLERMEVSTDDLVWRLNVICDVLDGYGEWIAEVDHKR